MLDQSIDRTVSMLQHTIIALMRHRLDLSVPQLAIFLIYYLDDGPHSLGSLAERLEIERPTISRAIDRLCQLDLVDRKRDTTGCRTLYVKQTIKGSAFLQELHSIMSEAEVATRQANPSPHSADEKSAYR
jgi:DNA-binding MarR family transcriptional regulator